MTTVVEERPGEVAEGRGGGGRASVGWRMGEGRRWWPGEVEGVRCRGDGLMLTYRTLHCVPQPLNMRHNYALAITFYPATYFSVIVQSKLV